MVYFNVREKGRTQWRLLVSSADPLSSTNYLAHSYRWGSSQVFFLTRKTGRLSMWKTDPCTTPDIQGSCDYRAPFLHQIHLDDWRNDIEKSQFHKRGWVLQERLLAPRVLHFGKRQVDWECYQTQKSKRSPLGVRYQGYRLKDFNTLFRNSGPKKAHVRPGLAAHSALAFSDRLVALLGLAGLFEGKTGD